MNDNSEKSYRQQAFSLIGKEEGAMKLIKRLGEILNVKSGQVILNISCSKCVGAILLVQEFDCQVYVLGSKPSPLIEATTLAADMQQQIHFLEDDKLSFKDNFFDYIIADLTFFEKNRENRENRENKEYLFNELYRILKRGRKIALYGLTSFGEGISDTIYDWLSQDKLGKDIGKHNEYLRILYEAGFKQIHWNDETWALSRMLDVIQGRILLTELTDGLESLKNSEDLGKEKSLIREIRELINKGILKYTFMMAYRM